MLERRPTVRLSVPPPQKAATPFRRGLVIAPAADLYGVQAPDGSTVPTERLGPGIVEQVDQEGRVRVRWLGAGFDCWLEPGDLRLPGGDTHLIAISRVDRRGNSGPVRHKVVAGSGLEHNWTVEIRPANVVRVVRADGCAWTFRVIPVFRRLVTTEWSIPPEDADAEAFTVAEMAALG